MDALSLGVLLADSDDTRLQALSRMINQLGHRVVAVAAGGRQAVALARDIKPDAAVVGPLLDDMSGPAAAGMLGRTCPLPIVLLMDDGDVHQPEDLAVLGVRAWVPPGPGSRHFAGRAGRRPPGL